MLLLFTYITYLLTIYFLHPLTVSSVTGVVIRAPTSEHATHLLQLYTGVKTSSREFDLDMHSHTAIPLYAYDGGHPLELLTRVGHWKECVIISRTPGTNQFVVRMGPAGHQFWALLLPWNHRSLSYHVAIPLFAVHVRRPAHRRSSCVILSLCMFAHHNHQARSGRHVSSCLIMHVCAS